MYIQLQKWPGNPKSLFNIQSVQWNFATSQHILFRTTLSTIPDQIPVYLVYTVCTLAVYTGVHWWHTGHTLSNPVYSYTGATLGPLQCMHSVHCQCTSSVYTNYTGIWSGMIHNTISYFTLGVSTSRYLAWLSFASSLWFHSLRISNGIALNESRFEYRRTCWMSARLHMEFHIIHREMKTKFNLPPITYLCVSSGSWISIASQFHIMWGNQTGI